MDCPKCPGKLETIKIEGVKIDKCYVCEGLWFDDKELKEVIKKDFKSLDFFDFDKNDADDIDEENVDGTEIKGVVKQLDMMPGKCPCCRESLNREKYKSMAEIDVDVCPKCHGVWLDGGEIKKLRNTFLRNIKNRLIAFKEFLIDLEQRRIAWRSGRTPNPNG